MEGRIVGHNALYQNQLKKCSCHVNGVVQYILFFFEIFLSADYTYYANLP
jgi:hypothetical protein